MKTLFLIGLLAVATSCFAQLNEFQTYQGLIYPEHTVNKLKHIVDSLNLKFKVCENRPYFSMVQAKANFVELEKSRVKEAVADMKNNISYVDFINKYKKATTDKDLLVIVSSYEDDKNKKIVRFRSVSFDADGGHTIDLDKDLKRNEAPSKGKWIYEYSKASKYSEEYVQAFYFIEEPRSVELPDQYARLVQYSDCMIDTTSTIYTYTKESSAYGRYKPDDRKEINEFLEYAKLHHPDPPAYDEEDSLYGEKYDKWDSLKWIALDKLAGKDAKFNQLLQEGVEAVLNSSANSTDEFELFVERYSSKETALELKRKRMVVGRCSMDDSPRRHAVEIARLSAEAVKWEIFLRAHLDVMNDRFERMSDGSYAWSGRQTYIKELEVLDIHVHDLLLGITLRVDNTSSNHYFGSVRRLGRALAETLNPEAIEERMLKMIGDTTLDDYNRVIMFFLLDNYVYNLDDQVKRTTALTKLKQAAATLPSYLASKVEIEDSVYLRNSKR